MLAYLTSLNQTKQKKNETNRTKILKIYFYLQKVKENNKQSNCLILH